METDSEKGFWVSNDACFECGGEVHEYHHVVPYSRGGTRMVPLCGPCHGKAHGLTGRKANLGELAKEGKARMAKLTVEQVVAYRDKGCTKKQTCKHLRITRTSLEGFLRRHGLTWPRYGNGKVPTEAEIDEMLRLRSEELSTPKIADRMGFSADTVSKYLKKRGVDIRPIDMPTKAEIDEMLRLSAEGLSTYKIADRVRCSRSTVCRYLKKRGVDTRHPGTPTEAEVYEMVRLRGLGLAQRAIADRVGCSQPTVQKYLQKRGVK